MSTTPRDGQVPLFTIGYGARSLDAFFAVLKANDITYLIDIRSAPYSRFKPEFSKQALEAAARAAGFTYVYMGDTLGGQPQDATCYEDGKVVYDRVKERPFFRDGMARLRRAAERNLRVALMCSEGKPEQCHRTVLIGQALADLAIDVVHIDENDGLIGQDEALGRRTSGQLSLLDDPEFKSRKRYKKKTNHEEPPADD
ncbi:MAG: DUF488 family protein [Nitrososphaerales archaeon]